MSQIVPSEYLTRGIFIWFNQTQISICVISEKSTFTPPTAHFWLRNLQSLSEPANNSRFTEDGPVLCDGFVDSPQDPIHLHFSEFSHLHALLHTNMWGILHHLLRCKVDYLCLTVWSGTVRPVYAWPPHSSPWRTVMPECVPLWILSLHLPKC